MNLEQLKAMSDAELNELSAVKVMGWNVSKEDDGTDETFLKRFDGDTWHILSAEWNPTTDMNDAMELAERFDKWQFQKVPVVENRKRITIGRHTIYHESLTRGITIASILAKEE